MRLQGVFYRAHDPRWAWSPLSGDGAAIHGGRWNAKGTPALYLSASMETAIVEVSHGFSERLEPLTLCSYNVDCDDIADLTAPDERALYEIADADMKCAWFDISKTGSMPPSWIIAERLKRSGCAGVRAPSFAVNAREGDANLVLWEWGPGLPHMVNVYDPSGRLPKNMLSWD